MEGTSWHICSCFIYPGKAGKQHSIYNNLFFNKVFCFASQMITLFFTSTTEFLLASVFHCTFLFICISVLGSHTYFINLSFLPNLFLFSFYYEVSLRLELTSAWSSFHAGSSELMLLDTHF